MAGTLVRTVNAKKLDRLLLIGSLWTPPHWMKHDAGINSWSNNSIGGHLKMDADNLEQFGRYVSAWVKGFEEHNGVPFYAISIQNELQFKEGYNSCQYTPAEYHDAVKAVGLAFAKYGITTKIMGPEGVGPDGGFFTGKQMEWINAVKTDPATAPYLSFFCIHGYGGNGIDMISDGAGLRDYSAKLEKFHAESWMTESSGENPDWLHSDAKGGQDGALSLARHIHEGLVYGNYNAVVYWQCGNGKPIFGETLMGATAESAAASGKYACAKHYFRYIRPGAVRVSVEPEIPTLGVSAFVHDLNRTLTIVMVNTGAEVRTIRLKLPDKPEMTKFAAFRSTERERFAAQPDALAADGMLTITIPAQAVETLNGQE
jgi:O-glycosyl hydrolase